MFYLKTHSTHFIYRYVASDIWLRTNLIVRKETRCHYIGYSYRLTARVRLYASSHRQDNTHHGLCYTSRGALAGTRNSSMGPRQETVWRVKQFYIDPRMSMFSPEKQFKHGIYPLPIVRIVKTLIFDGPMFLPEGRKEIFYLTTHSTHFIYCYMG